MPPDLVTAIEDLLRESLRFSHQAMATIFEIFIFHEDKQYASQAAHTAFAELDRLEQELSRFIENSDISRIGALNKGESTRLSEHTYRCLKQCEQIYSATGGAFDITIGSLWRCWLHPDRSLRNPTGKELQEARQRTGMHLLQMHEEDFSVTVLQDRLELDLGGYGKGYGVDLMAEVLREWDIEQFFVHGGGSSALGNGAPGDLPGWPVALSHPQNRAKTIQTIYLNRQAISGSGVEKGRHILNPRTAEPVRARRATWVLARDTGTSDALATAFMILSQQEIQQFCYEHPDILALVFDPDLEEQLLRFGPWPSPN